MRRKIIKQGNNSYTLTLPIRWIKNNKLDGGDEIEIDDIESRLEISVPRKDKKAIIATSFDVSTYNKRTIKNILNQSYRKGFDRIIIKIKADEQLQFIKEIVKETMLGFEVTEEKTDSCTIDNIAEPSSEKYEVLLRKIFLIIKQEAQDILQELKENRKPDMKKRQETKNSMDNYTNFIRRIIIKDKIGGVKNSYLIFYSVSLLSLILHAYYYMCDIIIKDKLKLSRQSIAMIEKTNMLFNDYYNAFYKKDVELAHKVNATRDKILSNDLYPLMKKTKGSETIILQHSAEILRLCQMASTVVFGLISEKIEVF